MPVRPAREPIATVLFDEAHGEAWTIRPDVARAIQPAHPQDSSYELAARALRTRDVAVTAHPEGPLDADALRGADVLVLAHPSDGRWERTVPGGSPLLSRAELDAIEAFVRDGGGLVVLDWTDNRLTIDWSQIASGVGELRVLVEALYHDGIDRTQLQHWGAAHDLVAAYVPPATGSRWTAGARPFGDGDAPRATVDLVLDDEFPLSIFFASLRTVLAPALIRPPLR
jgi:hypothetical protein